MTNQETKENRKSWGWFFKTAAVITLAIGGFFMYTGLFYMFLNNNIDGMGIVFEILGAAFVVGGALLWDWERKWTIFGIVLIAIGIFVPLITISTISMMSSTPELAGKAAGLSKIPPAILGAACIVFGIVSIFGQRKRSNSS